MMGCGGYQKNMMLCPFSLGLALGITSGLAVFIWTLWMMYYGVPPGMSALIAATPTLVGGLVMALVALIKGFIFGFFLALFYDFFACCVKNYFCRDKVNGACACGCGCKTCGVKKPAPKM